MPNLPRRTELLEMLANGENSQVEFKRDEIDGPTLAREVVALLNTDGGMIILGVDDSGVPVGLTNDRIKDWVMTVCNDKIRPPVVPDVGVVQNLRPGVDVAVVSVPIGVTVHTVWHNNKHRYFIRAGSQCREPSPERLDRLAQQRGTRRLDNQRVHDTTLPHLDSRRLHDYFERRRGLDVSPESDGDMWLALLRNSEFMVEDGVTMAGLLLFGSEPNRFLPQAGIDAVAFPGVEKDYNMLDRETLRGPMTKLESPNGILVEPGLVERTLAFVNRNIRHHAHIEPGGTRVDTQTYPVEVVREAVVNALIHRDYSFSGTDIEVTIYANRLEVISPGRLPNGVTPQRMREGRRFVRNPVLANVMQHYGYIEHLGMGVPRKIIHGMKEHNGTEVDLIAEDDRFTVRLHATDWKQVATA